MLCHDLRDGCQYTKEIQEFVKIFLTLPTFCIYLFVNNDLVNGREGGERERGRGRERVRERERETERQRNVCSPLK